MTFFLPRFLFILTLMIHGVGASSMGAGDRPEDQGMLGLPGQRIETPLTEGEVETAQGQSSTAVPLSQGMGSGSFAKQVFETRDLLGIISQYLSLSDISRLSRTYKKIYEMVASMRQKPFPHLNINLGSDADLKNVFAYVPRLSTSVHMTVKSSLWIFTLAEVKEKLVTPLKARGVERIEITLQQPIQYSISNETDLKTLISIKEDLESVTIHGVVAMVQNLNLIRHETVNESPDLQGQPYRHMGC